MNKYMWHFSEYYDQKKDYPDNPFFTKIFEDFDEMKNFSAERSEINRFVCADYCSDYVKVFHIC